MGKRISVVVALALLAVATAFVFRHDGPTVKEVGMNGTTTSGDGTTIAYTKLGSGPPLILVDGAFCYRENGPRFAIRPAARQTLHRVCLRSSRAWRKRRRARVRD